MASRSLTRTLALAFAGTTLAVFALVGSVLYFALDREVKQQDDLDIVLIARHARRLVEELGTLADLSRHADRLTSQVLGNAALSMEILGADRNVLLAYNTEGIADPATPSPALSRRIGETQRIVQGDIAEWHTARGVPVRGVATDALLRDGTRVTLIIARNMTDRWVLLDYYRDRLYWTGLAGVLLAFLMSSMLVRESLRPLREIASKAGTVTVDRLGTRIEAGNVPRELAALVASLNRMLDRLHDGFQRLSQYTADLAHDMRTPLGNLRSATEVVLARPHGVDEYQAALVSNLEECDRLSRMIESVLFLARAEHPQFAVRLGDLDAAKELAHIADYFEGLADDAGVHLRVTGDAHLRADAELFRRAVSNLLANALRYTPRGGDITLSAEASPDAVRVTVANQGPTIAPELLERIFDRFYRVDPSRRRETNSSGSTGLGLAIVRTIMDLHGGRAHAESDAASTRFTLTFPKSFHPPPPRQ
ncbi:heavy metal sensor histidine kinase [Caballeronia ptereochthonis]|uniref:Sensor protein n=1 Tax=Caballeronia ptereochthonis TaxID=1777144 RepID=A0A157ZHC2_9BURK|nr:heavy metal sensor histidine kinase [Caballeronia ptereochthonis]SAK44942.1 heavy metal sensor signal transduction histidine kinase [Caballeronia ptereochthonis]